MKFMLCALASFLLIPQDGHCTLTIILKDPISSNVGGAMISSNPNITDLTLPGLMPAQKSVGITGWGGRPDFSWPRTSEVVLKMLASHETATTIQDSILKISGTGYYRYAFMSNDGMPLGGVAPYCDETHNDCAVYIDAERSIVISAGGQEPGSILKTFNRLQALQVSRLSRFKKGLDVIPFPCYVANALAISQEFGAETAQLRAAGIVLDLEDTTEIVSATQVAAVEVEIVTNLKKKLSTNLNLDCK